MKKSFVVVFLLAALTLTLLAGCQSANADNPIAASASFTPLMQQQVLETPTPQQPLTAEEAEAIALAHAGLTREEVVFDRTETDLEKGKQVFEVEFRSGDFEYDYTIDTTGQVLHWEKEHDPEKPAKPEKPVTPEVPAEPEKPVEPEVPVDPEKPVEPEVPIEPEKPVEPEKKPLTAEEAEAIALAHAGLTREEVVFDRTETDLEKGKQVFEVEFRSGDFEYDYTIDTTTGQVLHWEKEHDPEKPAKPEKPVTPEVPAEPEKPVAPEVPAEPEKKPLTAEEAEAIALAHAGLTREEVIFDRTETDLEKGKQVFEVEFRKGNWEYSYEIDAETGKVLEWEKEYDD